MSNKKIDYPFTAYPNYLIDEVMPEIEGNSLTVLTLIARKTIGFHKTYDKIALSQFEELTGLSKNTVIKALNYLCEKKIIQKVKTGKTYKYRIILPSDQADFGSTSSSPLQKNSSHSEPSGSTNEPAPVHNLNSSSVQPLNTQKKPIKETITKDTTTKEGELERVI